MVLTDELQYAHSHQVLHVSFSHNGRMFATCSKDGFVHVSPNTSIHTNIKLLILIDLLMFCIDMEFITSSNNQIFT